MVPGARLIVLGKQGAGKGTQCVRLSHHYVIPHISTGDMLRAAVKQKTDLGREAQRYMDAGELVPDELLLSMLERRLAQDDTCGRGFVLDGFPRTTAQAEALDVLLRPFEIDVVIDLDVPTALVLERLASRRVCADCGANYSVSAPPKVDWICDICGGEVVQRPDDTEAAIQRRLDLYEKETAPLVSWYEQSNRLVRVAGTGTPDDVTERMVRAIDEHRRARLGERP